MNALIQELQQKYNCIKVIDLAQCNDNFEQSSAWLEKECRQLVRPAFEENQRIIFLHTKDLYVKNSDNTGLILKKLQIILNEVDIPCYFVIVLSSSPNLQQEISCLESINTDDVDLTFYSFNGEFNAITIDKYPFSKKDYYQYGSSDPIKITLNDLSLKERYLLTDSKTFCIYPWIHLHAWPTGQALPCCHAEPVGELGNLRLQSLADIWNSDIMKKLRCDMLSDTPNVACKRCYEQEESGFFSGRKSANKHHGHHISRISKTDSTGHVDQFEMTYWDVRFSNLCNLSCRSCGHIFSSSWYSDQAALAGSDWKKHNKPLNYAGRYETDMWEQLEPHLDYVEQIYFAGGEPLLMEEHYNILEELVRRERFDVRLIYNTNFTHTQLKDRSVFEYWKLFDSVAVGASLDAVGPRAEYIRKGTDWEKVEANRIEMMRVCPDVDFYISPTLSIMNADHLPDFHRQWVKKGLINPQDLNVNILQDPAYYRIDIATPEYKDRLRNKYLTHIEWLRPLDPLQRATVGFESAIKFMDATDNTHLLPEFWSRTRVLDQLRNEDVLNVLPELNALL